MKPLARRALAVSLALALIAPLCAAAAEAPIPPAPTQWVTDQAGFLSPSTRQALNDKLSAYERQSGHQVIVWIGRTTGGVPIEDWSVRAFQAWRVGRKGLDDGLALFIFADDRKMHIEVGYGLEDRVPDAVASRVIREVLTPGFRAGERDAAVSRAVDALLSAIEGKPFTSPTARTRQPAVPIPGPAALILMAIAALAFLILFLVNPSLAMSLLFILSSGRGRGRRGGGWGGGGWGGGGWGGGGGFSGGGGRSGGGGASGSW